jgi:hypothetical protein
MEITVPEDWKSKGFYGSTFVASLRSDDVERASNHGESGPKFKVDRGRSAGWSAYDAGFLIPDSAEVDEPQSVMVGSEHGASITFSWSLTTVRYVVVNVDSKRAYIFELSAPTSQWERYKDDFEDILSSVRFKQPVCC